MRILVLLSIAGAILWWWVESRRRKRHPVSPGLQPQIDIPHEQEFELYHNALSLCSMKTRLCLAELKIPYKSHHIDLIETGCYENIRPRLLDVNPAGTVPVLIHEGHPIYESHEQIRYAAEHAPPAAPSLVPEDPGRRAEMERWVDLSSLTEDPLEHGDESAGNAVPALTVPLFATMVEKIPYWKIVEGLLFHFDRMRPSIFLIFKARGIDKLGSIAPAVRIVARGRKQLGAHLDALEAQLEQSGGPWILGEQFTLADVGWLVIFERFRQADCLHVFVGDGLRPLCASYWDALRKRPSYREAIQGNSHPMIEHGTRRLREAKAADPALREILEGRAREARAA